MAKPKLLSRARTVTCTCSGGGKRATRFRSRSRFGRASFSLISVLTLFAVVRL